MSLMKCQSLELSLAYCTDYNLNPNPDPIPCSVSALTHALAAGATYIARIYSRSNYDYLEVANKVT